MGWINSCKIRRISLEFEGHLRCAYRRYIEIPQTGPVRLTEAFDVADQWGRGRIEGASHLGRLRKQQVQVVEIGDGDGRLFILGDKGFIEIRKYTDLAKSERGNQLFLANNDEVKHIDCSNVKLPYFANLIKDVLNRTDTACSQELTFLSMELAIKAQELAEKKWKNIK